MGSAFFEFRISRFILARKSANIIVRAAKITAYYSVTIAEQSSAMVKTRAHCQTKDSNALYARSVQIVQSKNNKKMNIQHNYFG